MTRFILKCLLFEFGAILLALTPVTILHATDSIRTEKRELKAELRREVREAEHVLDNLRMDSKNAKKDASGNTRLAIAGLEEDITNLRDQIKLVDHASPVNWDIIKTTAQGSIDRVEEAIRRGKSEKVSVE